MMVMVGSLPYNQNFDLCETIEDFTNLSCPVKRGTLSIGVKMPVPDYVPAVRERGREIWGGG